MLRQRKPIEDFLPAPPSLNDTEAFKMGKVNGGWGEGKVENLCNVGNARTAMFP